MATKRDLAEASREEYDDMMGGDPGGIMQARMPDDIPPLPGKVNNRVDYKGLYLDLWTP